MIDLRRDSDLTFVIPCWNEEEVLPVMIAAIIDAGDRAVAAGLIDSWTAVLVDDGSTDSTATILAATSEGDARFRVVTHAANQGLGAAIRSGFAAATGGLVLYTDADMPCDLSHEVPRALTLLRNYRADVVAAYRFDRRGEGMRRLAYSAAYNLLVRATFGLRLRDVNFAFKLFRAGAVDVTSLQSSGSFIDVEMLARAKASSLKVVQFGVEYFPRTRGVSTLSSVGTITTIVREMRSIGRGIPRSERARHAGDRILIVNADDYGLTRGISEGILRAADRGIVTSTSVLVLGNAFASTIGLLRDGAPAAGVHLAAVGEDPPLLSKREIPTLVDDRGRLRTSWRQLLPALAAGRVDPADLSREFAAQVAAVREAGIDITHFDTHQHLHLWPVVADVVMRLAQAEGVRAVRVPRSSSTGPKGAAIRVLADRAATRARDAGLVFPDWAAGLDEAGHMHGSRLDAALRLLLAKDGDVELSAHPGLPRDTDRYAWGYDWEEELDALSSPALRTRVEAAGVVLGSYRSLTRPAA